MTAPRVAGILHVMERVRRHTSRPAGATRSPRRLPRLLAAFCACLLLAACSSRAPSLPEAAPQPTPGDPGAAVVATARSQIGSPYAYGACSPEDGYDCSGLVWWTYRQNGVEVPRTSHGQWGFGRFVAPNDRRPGDVVVFRIGHGAKDLHVGIFTERGSFVHSPKVGDTVREEPISMPYWQKRYLGAKRYLPDPAPIAPPPTARNSPPSAP